MISATALKKLPISEFNASNSKTYWKNHSYLSLLGDATKDFINEVDPSELVFDNVDSTFDHGNSVAKTVIGEGTINRLDFHEELNYSRIIKFKKEIVSTDLAEDCINSVIQQFANPRKITFARMSFEKDMEDVASVSKKTINCAGLLWSENLPALHHSNNLDTFEPRINDWLLMGLIPFALSQLKLNYQSLEPPNSITIVETSALQTAMAMCLFDMESLVDFCKTSNIKIQLICSTDQENLHHDLYDYISTQIPTAILGMQVVPSPISSPESIKLTSWLFSHEGLGWRFLNSIGTSSDELNQLIQGIYNLSGSDRKLLTSGLPIDPQSHALIVASGPSIDQSLEAIKQYQNNFTIFAAGSAIGQLLDNQIRVDACIFNERDAQFFEDLTALKQYEEQLRDIVLISSAQSDPRLAQLFADNIIFHRPASSVSALMSNEAEDHSLIHSGPESSNAALDSVLFLGFTKLVLVGVDFGAIDPAYIRCNDAIGTSPRDFDIPVKGNLGKTIFSNPSLIYAASIFDATIKYYASNDLLVTRFGHGAKLDFVDENHEDIKKLKSIALSSKKVDIIKIAAMSTSLPAKSHKDIKNISKQLICEIKSYQNHLIDILQNTSCFDRYFQDQVSKVLKIDSGKQSEKNKLDVELSVARLYRQVLFYLLTTLYDIPPSDRAKFQDKSYLVQSSILYVANVSVNIIHALNRLIEVSFDGTSEWSRQNLQDFI